MFAKVLTQAGHVRRFLITNTGTDWEVREEQDSAVVRQVRYTDWHRVERALASMTDRVIELERHGWHSAG